MLTARALTNALRRAGVDATDDRHRCRSASHDYSWLSPVLTARLPDEPAIAIAFPVDVDQLAAALGVAHRYEVPVTPRGRGTGNYGQAVPLHGGLVIDTTALDRTLDVLDGWALVEPGVTCGTLERTARASGQELALFPSTTNSTIGGFLAGGAGGSGSIEHGFVWDGFVGGLKVLDCADEPTITDVVDAGARPFLHAYGTTGVLATARVRLQPSRRWTALYASFPSFSDAAAVGTQLLAAGTRLRLLGVTEAPLAAMIEPHRYLDPDRASLRAVVAAESLDDAINDVRSGGGRVDASGEHLTGAVTAMSYNHVTLRAKRNDSSVCHLQVGGSALTERTAEVRACVPDGRLHLDAMRSAHGPEFGGLLISTFHGEVPLQDGIAAIRALGLHVVDPHTWMVHDPDGTMGSTALKMDPAGLLNPGKLVRQ